MKSTKDVLEHHLEVFRPRQPRRHFSKTTHRTPSCLALRLQGPLKGLQGIKPVFQKPSSPSLCASPVLGSPCISSVSRGDYAYILWSAETADNLYDAATDTFVVRNEKILAQCFLLPGSTPKR